MGYNLGPVNHSTQQFLQRGWPPVELADQTTREDMLKLLLKQNQRGRTVDLPCLADTRAVVLHLWDRLDQVGSHS